MNPNNPYALDNPPMPREEYMRRELLSFAKKFVICTSIGLGFAAFFYAAQWGW